LDVAPCSLVEITLTLIQNSSAWKIFTTVMWHQHHKAACSLHLRVCNANHTCLITSSSAFMDWALRHCPSFTTTC
jgi:hypothetical protein